VLDKGGIFYSGGFVIPNKVKDDFVSFRTDVLRDVHDAADKDKS